jgi:hypothetical protein
LTTDFYDDVVLMDDDRVRTKEKISGEQGTDKLSELVCETFELLDISVINKRNKR